MELIIKRFDELTVDELYEILRLRVDVFVVEQECPYPDVDGRDPAALHVFLRDSGGVIQAYLRLLPPGQTFETASMGRVIARQRRQGLGTQIVAAGIRAASDQMGADVLTIEAQTYARKLYEQFGFVQTSEEFLEDGIPHIQMRLELSPPAGQEAPGPC